MIGWLGITAGPILLILSLAIFKGLPGFFYGFIALVVCLINGFLIFVSNQIVLCFASMEQCTKQTKSDVEQIRALLTPTEKRKAA